MNKNDIPVSLIAKRQISKFLKEHGYRSESGYFVMHRGGLTVGVKLFFHAKGQSDVSELSIELFGWATGLPEIMGRNNELGWKSPLVAIELQRLAGMPRGFTYVMRKDQPTDVEDVVKLIEEGFIEKGFPWLESIQSERDIVRMMRDDHVGYGSRVKINEWVGKYLEVHPDL